MRTYEPLPLGAAGELCRPGQSPSAVLGQCVIDCVGQGAVRIVQADAVIAVSGELLRDWHDGTPPGTSLTCAGDPDHIGDLIRVEATDQRVAYVVTRVADRENDVWEARWPD